MAECLQCGAYTKYSKGLCYECYQEKNGKKEEENTLVTDRDLSYRFNMIKGRIAETLIQELFLSLKFPVFSYGMENTIPGVMGLLKGVRSDVANEIRRMPDFVVQNPHTQEVYFVEVKFRANETFTRKDLPKDYAWTNAYFILVSKKHIKCVSFAELEAGEEITPTSKNYLGNRKEFDLDKDVIKEFCDFALLFFQGV
ncbi:MAG: hypothetical protein JNL40_09825 [Cyclobacteriaceae bacterium]|nr:hypothetical protein [Cyclobacteriaceae bacterium]